MKGTDRNLMPGAAMGKTLGSLDVDTAAIEAPDCIGTMHQYRDQRRPSNPIPLQK